MPNGLIFILLILGIGLLGLAVWPPHSEFEGKEQSGLLSSFTQAFLTFLAGLALLSLVMMVLAIVGLFFGWAILGGTILVAGAAWFWAKKTVGSNRAPTRSLARTFGSFLLIAALALLANTLARPWESKLASSDASIYLGAAAQLADSGRLAGPDPLVAEMSSEERQVLFGNRFAKDSTGEYARFPGGVPLTDLEQGTVSFYFYHLWPIWLALGQMTMGDPGFLAILPFFALLSLLAFFLLGQQLAGTRFALVNLLACGFCFPQAYYSRLPMSEIPAQGFFLAGLFVLLLALQKSGNSRRQLQILAGALWGSFALCRADGVLFLPVALGAALLCFPQIRRQRGEWTPFATTLFCYLLLAVLHQLASTSYLAPLANLPILGHRGWLSQLLLHHESVVVLGLLLFFAWVGMRYRRWGEAGRRVVANLLPLLAVMAVAGWLFTYARQFDRQQIWRHLTWLTLYLPPWLLALGGIGLLRLLPGIIRRPQGEHLRNGILLLLLGVPLLSLLINPMVTATQPWAIRRFVPMVLPLFLTLSCLGWAQKWPKRWRLFNNHRRLGLAILTLALGGYFFSQAAFLNRRPLYSDLGGQLGQLASRIPKDALVLLPDSEAGIHLQTALHYGLRRTVLLLPLSGELDRDDRRVIENYLQRQIASGRPLLTLFCDPGLRPQLLTDHFDLNHLFTEAIAYEELPQVDGWQFPGSTQAVNLRYQGFQIRERGALPIPARIGIGKLNEDLPWLGEGFFPPEGRAAEPDSWFRWSMGQAEFTLPPVRRVKIHYHLWRPPQAPPLALTVSVDNRPLPYTLKESGQSGLIDIPLPPSGSPTAERLRLHLECTPFSMQALGLAADPRSLGLAIYRLELVE